MGNRVLASHLALDLLNDEAVWAVVDPERGPLADGGRLGPVARLSQRLPTDVQAKKGREINIKLNTVGSLLQLLSSDGGFYDM